MNRFQRRVHAVSWLLLSVLLPAILVAAISARHAPAGNLGVRWEQFR